MSWKVHETDEVFAGLRGLCSNAYRMYDPSEHRCYYDHDCETYECAVDEAAEEYERLVEHCAHQREQLAKRSRSKTIGILMELLNEYRLSECALDEGRVSWYAARLDGRTVNEHWMNGERTEEGAAMSITDELRERIAAMCRVSNLSGERLYAIADRIDKEHAEAVADALQLRGEPDRWVELPVDADGVPIHVGDEVEGLHGENANAKFLVLHEDGVWDVGDRGWVPSLLCHRKPDSWERIIRDIRTMNGCGSTGEFMERHSAELVERCRRLAGDAE